MVAGIITTIAINTIPKKTNPLFMINLFLALKVPKNPEEFPQKKGGAKNAPPFSNLLTLQLYIANI